MTIHSTPHPLAGKTVTLTNGASVEIEDWWDRVFGQSWMFSQAPVAYSYAARSSAQRLPLDDEVVYGKDAGRIGHLVHVSEIAGGGS